MTFSAIKAFLGIVPTWCWWLLALAALCLGCELHGRSVIEKQWRAEREQLAERAREVGRAQSLVVTKTQIKYADLIQRIYVQGTSNEKRIGEFVTDDDSKHFGVNVGFVRMHDAAWSGAAAGPADSADRGPASVSLADVTAVDVHNATSCLAWQRIAIGLRENYKALQEAAAAGTSS